MPLAIIDERISDKCKRRLSALGFYTISLPPSKDLSAPIASHADMLMFYHKNKIITSADYCDSAAWVFSDIREYSKTAEITFTADVYKKEYPGDAIFNVLTTERYAFLKEDTASATVKEHLKNSGLTLVNVKQGYPACTVLTFGNAAITADDGMARALEKGGIKVTKIQNGGISLPPYEYGFIGGAAGVFKDKVYFAGNLEAHPDAKKISEAISSEGFIPISLSDGPLSDVGRIIFIE